MKKNNLLKVIGEISEISRETKSKLVFMGGIAFSALARPRATFDIDGIISLQESKVEEFLKHVEESGFEYDKKNPVKLIRGLPFITLFHAKSKIYVDLFLAKTEFEKEILGRAKGVRFNGLKIFIISVEDLILIKLRTARQKDMEDARELILENKSRLDIKYLKKWAKSLGVDIFLQDELKSLELWNKI